MTASEGSGIGVAVLLVAVGFVLTTVHLVVQDRGRHAPPGRYAPERRVPPEGVSVLVAAHCAGMRARSTSAQLVDLVQRGALDLGRDDDGWWVEVRDVDGLDHVEGSFVTALVGVPASAGMRARVSRSDGALRHRVRTVQALVNDVVVRDGLRAVVPLPVHRWPLLAGLVALTLVAIRRVAEHPQTAFAVVSLAIMTVVVLLPPRHRWHALTDTGMAVREQVLGIDRFLTPGGWVSLVDPPAPPSPEQLRALLPWAVVVGLERHTAGVLPDDGPLKDFIAEFAARPTSDADSDHVPGDAWDRVATGGSPALHDGATYAKD
ncbi:DUF2207 family protein [Sanguibacter suaedae]|uniref:DUF2207 domain-containing protein n=1 Tax=Sanguibacter suaedae TaxID=2795737 RepID=A0A934I370_9MICO|nr:DUF2207 domain-containing protein [Sanguibacter suaedae]MBI9113401.1 DUF2207 domain-containing protein [Sanguibacter suaedae]